MSRKFAAVGIGYLIFAISAVLLFQLSAHDPHSNPTLSFAVFVISYGMVFACAGGFVARWIAGGKSMTVNYALAVLMGALAAFSLFATRGNHYTQIAAVFLFAPISILGGVIRHKYSQ